MNPGRGKTFSLLQDMQTGSGAHPASYSMGTTRVLSQGPSSWGVKLTTQVKNKWSHIYTPPIHLHCMDRENIIIID